jgi:hypothetical protein
MVLATSTDPKILAWPKEEKQAVDKALEELSKRTVAAEEARLLAERRLGAMTEEQLKAEETFAKRAKLIAANVRAQTEENVRAQVAELEEARARCTRRAIVCRTNWPSSASVCDEAEQRCLNLLKTE